MTNKEAIDSLKFIMDYYKDLDNYTINQLRDLSLNLTSDEIEALDIAIQALEQEHTLDKIRAEIKEVQTYKMFEGEDAVYVKRNDVLEIIDKYITESELESELENPFK